MDNKELIELSRKAAVEWQGTHEYYQTAVLITSLCDATETLLAERAAAVEMLRGECHACKHNAGWHNVGKCCTCIHENAGPLIPMEQCDDNWEWRSPTPPDRERTES